MKIIKSIKTIAMTSIFAVTGILGLSTLTLTPAFADDVCNSNAAQAVKDAAGCGSTSKDGLFNVVQAILNTIISVVSIVAVIFIVIGGVKYMTSAGDPSKASSARKTILYAAIGLVVCVLAFAIVNFVIATVLKQ